MGKTSQPWAVELDFKNKSFRDIPLEAAQDSMSAGHFVWIDVDTTELEALSAQLPELRIPEDLIEDALTGDAGTQHARYPDCLHMVLSGCHMRGHEFELQRVDVAVSEHALVTAHHGQVEFIERVKRDFANDFLHHAETPSFLIFELWDHLFDVYRTVQDKFEDRVSHIQNRLIASVSESLFTEIAEVSADLVHFRKVLLPARTVLTELATRRSRFVSEPTQRFLMNMVGSVERVLQDLLADREILADSLNLHISAVGHRTNEVIRRLTVVSVVFLPLTFLVGVYGMNFDYQPELHWRYGYAGFWLLVAAITGVLLFLLARKRLF